MYSFTAYVWWNCSVNMSADLIWRNCLVSNNWTFIGEIRTNMLWKYLPQILSISIWSAGNNYSNFEYYADFYFVPWSEYLPTAILIANWFISSYCLQMYFISKIDRYISDFRSDLSGLLSTIDIISITKCIFVYCTNNNFAKSVRGCQQR